MWEVWTIHDTIPIIVNAFNALQAAERGAELIDSQMGGELFGHEDLDENPVEVHVRQRGTTPIQAFKVFGSIQMMYRAEALQ